MGETLNRLEPTASAVRSAARRRTLRWWFISNLQIVGLAATLLLLGFLFSIYSPYFLTVNNLLNIGRAVAIRGIVAIGLTMVMISGGIDLSIASVMAATGMFVALVFQTNLPAPLAWAGGVTLGLVIGLTTSFFVTRVRINPLIATLGMMSIVRGLAFVFSKGVAISLPGNNVFQILARGRMLGIPNPLLLWVLIGLVAQFVLSQTRFGQYAYSIGGNEEACRVIGIKVDRVKTGLYVISAILAGFGGTLLTSLAGSASPTNAMGAELDIIAAVVLGGISLQGGSGSILGTFLGMLILGLVNNGMTLVGIPTYWQTVTRGAILMVAVSLDSLRTTGILKSY